MSESYDADFPDQNLHLRGTLNFKLTPLPKNYVTFSIVFSDDYAAVHLGNFQS